MRRMLRGHDVQRHLDLLFEPSPRDHPLFAAFRPFDRRSKDMGPAKYFDLSRPDTEPRIHFWVSRQVRMGYEVFLCPLPRARRSLRMGTSSHLTRTLYADLDHSHPLPPDIAPFAHTVLSGTRGHRQVYFMLATPLPVDKHQKYNRRLASFLDADSKWPENSLLRLAGTYNQKLAQQPVLARFSPEYRPSSIPSLTPSHIRHILGASQIDPDVPSPRPSQWRILSSIPSLRGELGVLWRDDVVGDGTARYRRSYKLVCGLLEKGFTVDEIHTLMLHHKPTLDKWPRLDQLHRQVDSVIRKWRSSNPTRVTLSPVDLWTYSPALRYIRDLARARRVGPWSLLGAVLANIIASTPASLRIPAYIGNEASLNLFVALVGPPGASKSASIKVAAHAYAPTEDMGVFVREGIGSGEGIAKLFRHQVKGRDDRWTQDWVNRQVLISVDEISNLGALTGRSGSTLLGTLNQAAMGEELSFSYSDVTKSIKIPEHEYRMSLIVGVQPMMALPLMREEGSGLPQRFLWFESTDRERERGVDYPEPERPEWPAPWIDTTVPQTVRFPAEVERWVKQQNDDILIRSITDTTMEAHTTLTRMKVAVALALLNGRVGVDMSDWTMSQAVMTQSNNVRQQIADVLRIEREKEKREEGRLDAIRNKARDVGKKSEEYWQARARSTVRTCIGKGIVTEGKMKPQFKGEKAKYLASALQEMLGEGEIEEVPTRRKDSRKFRFCVADEDL